MTEPGQGDTPEFDALEDELDELMLPEPGSSDFVDIERFAASLERIDATGASDSWLAIAGIDRREDPELASLLETAGAINRSLDAATQEQAFQSFHHRSRAAVVHLLEQDLSPGPRGGRAGAVIVRFRRSAFFAPLTAGVAAASIAAFAIFGGIVPGMAQPPEDTSVTNLTPRSTNQELVRISLALNTIRDHSERGEPVPAPLLREVAEGTARVASMIERTPEVVDATAVSNYTKTIETSQQVLESARTDPDDEGALVSAQLAMREGAEVASRYFAGQQPADAPVEVPTETPTGTASPEPTAEPTPTGTPVHEPEPTAEPTPSGTPVHEPDPPETSTPSPTPTPTPTPTASPTATGTATTR